MHTLESNVRYLVHPIIDAKIPEKIQSLFEQPQEADKGQPVADAVVLLVLTVSSKTLILI